MVSLTGVKESLGFWSGILKACNVELSGGLLFFLFAEEENVVAAEVFVQPYRGAEEGEGRIRAFMLGRNVH